MAENPREHHAKLSAYIGEFFGGASGIDVADDIARIREQLKTLGFAIEYGLRIWVAPEDAGSAHAAQARRASRCLRAMA